MNKTLTTALVLTLLLGFLPAVALAARIDDQAVLYKDVQRPVDVVALQHQLQRAGLYDGPLDGVFDEEIRLAVARFQVSRGLRATSVVSGRTIALLNALPEKAYIASRGGVVLGASTQAYQPTTLYPGVQNKTMVQELQRRLQKRGYYNGAIDGIYGSGTTRAVMQFQQANGLTPDGLTGKQTAKLLSS